MVWLETARWCSSSATRCVEAGSVWVGVVRAADLDVEVGLRSHG